MKDIGLVLVQHTPLVAHEPLISGVEHGLEEVLVRSDMRLVTRVVRDHAAELDVYRYWHATGAVDAVVLVRLTRDDKRVTFLNQLRVPFVAIADESQVGEFSAVAIDNSAMMLALIEHLTSRGHSRISYVSGPAEVELSSIRARAFADQAATAGVDGRVVTAELTTEGGQRATREVLGDESQRPTAIIYDDDVTAAAGLEAITSLGLTVPGDVAVIAWNDSVLCQSAVPSITAMSNEAHGIGLLVGKCLIDTVESGSRSVVHAPSSFIVERASA
jgi:DNA-binding LacI/PurR family transcriptional regulator